MDSSSEVCEQEEGSTSLTPESAGLGGKEPEISKVVKDKEMRGGMGDKLVDHHILSHVLITF